MADGVKAISLTIDGATIQIPRGSTVACAVLMVGAHTRTSVSGEPRAPLCGMGICMECRVTIDGRHHQRSCQILCEEGMVVTTDGGPALR